MELDGSVLLKDAPSEIHGYKRLIAWQNAARLRKLVYDVTIRFPKSEMRRISQMQDAARSVKQNIQEGYYRHSLAEYIQGLNIARGSLAELSGDLEDCAEDNLIEPETYSELGDLCIKTGYLLDKLMRSLRKIKIEGTWIKS